MEGPHVGALGEALDSLPLPLPPNLKLTVTGGKSDFFLTLITGRKESDAEFYPSDPDQIVNAEEQPHPGGSRRDPPLGTAFA